MYKHKSFQLESTLMVCVKCNNCLVGAGVVGLCKRRSLCVLVLALSVYRARTIHFMLI